MYYKNYICSIREITLARRNFKLLIQKIINDDACFIVNSYSMCFDFKYLWPSIENIIPITVSHVHTEKCGLSCSLSSQSNPVTSSCLGRLSNFLLPGLWACVGFPLPRNPAATQVLASLGLGAALPRPLPLPSNPIAAAYKKPKQPSVHSTSDLM